MMDTWTLQMGYPVVELKRQGTVITAEQRPFLLNPNTRHSTEYNSPFGYVILVTSSNLTEANMRLQHGLEFVFLVFFMKDKVIAGPAWPIQRISWDLTPQ